MIFLNYKILESKVVFIHRDTEELQLNFHTCIESLGKITFHIMLHF